MDYEKKYNELVERVKEFHEAGNALTKAQMEIILPELAESEKVKTKIAIIQFFRDAARGNTMVVNSEAFTEWADYLENKEEQKPTPDWMPKFLDELRSMKNYFDWDEHRDIEGQILAIINWIAPNYFNEKEKEQKSIEDAAKEVTKDKESAEKFLKTAGIVDENGNLAEIYRSEQEPTEWSEEDEGKLSAVISLMKSTRAVDPFYDKMCLEGWLKSLRPQPHTVSRKDATKFSDLEYERGVKDGLQHAENHHWKPSEEQMKFLDVSIAAALDNKSSNLASGLITLRKDLEKLI